METLRNPGHRNLWIVHQESALLMDGHPQGTTARVQPINNEWFNDYYE